MSTEQNSGYEKSKEELIIVEAVAVREDDIIEILVVEEIIDIEEHAKHGKTPPHARGYKIRIDKEYKTVNVPEMTGRQILGLVGKTPETYLLSQKLHGGQVLPIKGDEIVDFRRHGVERFQTLALDPTEGGASASRLHS
jgi:Multiubiquitin